MSRIISFEKELCTDCGACNIACRNSFPERKGKVRACGWCLQYIKAEELPSCERACPLRLILAKENKN